MATLGRYAPRVRAWMICLVALAACAKSKSHPLDLDYIRVSTDARLRTDTVGVGSFEEHATFVLCATITAASALLCAFTNSASGYGTLVVVLSGAARRNRTHASAFLIAGGRSSPTRSIWNKVTLMPIPKVRIRVAVIAKDG